jgi:hypothetical protein
MKEIDIWCAISVCGIIGPMFYDNTVTCTRYVNKILSPFFAELTEEKKLYGVSQQDSVAAHMANASLEEICEVFSDYVISCGLWPPCSSDLTFSDLYS